jgi:hypothetical protein
MDDLILSGKETEVLFAAVKSISDIAVREDYSVFFSHLEGSFALKQEGRCRLNDLKVRLMRCLGGAVRRNCLDYVRNGLERLAADEFEVFWEQELGIVFFKNNAESFILLNDLVVMTWTDILMNQSLERVLGMLCRRPRTKVFNKTVDEINALLRDAGVESFYNSYGQVMLGIIAKCKKYAQQLKCNQAFDDLGCGVI